jgi:YbbR domain-containing protein
MSLRHLIFHNFWLKVFSVGSGTIIWMAIHFSMDHDLSLSEPSASQHLIKEITVVPISILQEEGNARVFQITPTNVLVTVMGEARTLHGSAGREIKMYVDLTGYHSSAVTQEDLHPDVPPDIHVVEFKPHTVTVQSALP